LALKEKIVTNKIDNLKQNARKIRDDAVHTAEAVWTTTRDTVKAAGETAGALIDRTREAADAVVSTTRRKLQDARIKGRELEESARKVVVKAADRVERASHDLKQSQEVKARAARGKKDIVVKTQRAQAKGKQVVAKAKKAVVKAEKNVARANKSVVKAKKKLARA
jgi:hypothetical protein